MFLIQKVGQSLFRRTAESGARCWKVVFVTLLAAPFLVLSGCAAMPIATVGTVAGLAATTVDTGADL